MSKIIVAALISTALNLPLSAQSDFEYNLTKVNANKIVLIGDWKSADAGKWHKVINSDEIYIHGFVVLTRASLTKDSVFGFEIRSNDINAFERWLRSQYGLDGRTAWIALDMKNTLVASGINASKVPSPKELEAMLEKSGMKSPLKIIRDFLREHPDHLDAKSDLLTEARRLALRQSPADTSKDLDTEKDLLTWAKLANETDNVFKAPWVGIDIRFFRPDQDQPERYSTLMKRVFRKHIGAVESAIIEQPGDTKLWNIWAWMARSLPDYKWDKFVNSIEPFAFPGSVWAVCPSPDVCVWLIEEFRQKKDWEAVLKFAKAARGFSSIPANPKAEWMPSRGIKFANQEYIKDYPVKSAYAPHLEALLRLGKIKEANDVYDEMIRAEGGIRRDGSSNALIAANAARAAGMEELAKTWEQGQQITKVPYIYSPLFKGIPHFLVINRDGYDYLKSVSALLARLSPMLIVASSGEDDGVNVPWVKEEGKERWVLISTDRKILAQDTSMPDLNDLQNILNSNNIKSAQDYCRRYILENGTQPGLELYLAFEIIKDNREILESNQQSADSSKAEQIELQFTEAASRLNKVLTACPEALINMPYMFDGVSIDNQSMKSLSKKILENIELLLRRRPSLESLWNQWFFWRQIEGTERPIESLVEATVPSPLAESGTVPPITALDQYYYECRKNSNWPKVIKLLETCWDREYTRILRFQREDSNNTSSPDQDEAKDRFARFMASRHKTTLGDNVGVPLMEAYLNDDKPHKANEIFNAWLAIGGKFTDLAKVIELAKGKGLDGLVKEWEAKIREADKTPVQQ